MTFRKNDLDEVYYDFFEEIWQTGGAYADPSGWLDTESRAASLLPQARLSEHNVGRYYLDEGRALGPIKDEIAVLLGAWEGRALSPDCFTIYNSVSVGTLATLLVMKRRGVEHVLFETPAYSVTVGQAALVRLRSSRLPTYRSNRFAVDFSSRDSLRCPVALWLTQPRMGLGFNQNPDQLRTLLTGLHPNDFLVVDEATEQSFPSVLRALPSPEEGPHVIRIRGFLKGAGLNGVRLAFALHSYTLRGDFEEVQNILGASLDLWSTATAVELSRRPEQFSQILRIANQQAVALRSRAERIAFGSDIHPTRLVNGYMGSLLLDLKSLPGSFAEQRRTLLEHLRRRCIPVILGSTMNFAVDPPWEQVRVNYFSREHHVLRAVEELAAFLVIGRE